MYPANKYITRVISYLWYGVGSLSVITAGCKKNDTVHPAVAQEIKMEIIPVADTIRQVIASNTLLTASHPWYIDGWVYVGNEATLRIEAGAVVNILPTAVNKQDGRHSGGLVITRGAHIIAAGTTTLPIRIQVEKVAGQGPSGLLLLGKAPVRKGYTPFRDLTFGGNEPEDSSGVIRHLHLDYYPAASKDFRGGLLLLGTGSRTVIAEILQRALPAERADLKAARLR
ncbi:hypothetical protein [Chitinophaga qingshengii]|uniref:DUF5689 domain-containing protein n=1 Tax=Chitinophaga qingshengii TaxID=1569794 RepID=A0ABR7TLA5_9BACT|nr:hypothetical protein [Chitinophaga qingshengii]MBC9931249.1 hypothetical protein [Chitinophaga qingshengii]